MLSKAISGAIALTLLGMPITTQANEMPKVLVIADTGFDTQLPILRDRIVHEVCLLDWYSCPNGKNIQEGVGASALPLQIAQLGGFGHGTQMASIAVFTDPSVKFVLVRIIASSSSGTRLPTSDSIVLRLLEWVSTNREKYNIGAVAMAQGHHAVLQTKDYCPKTPAIEKKIAELKRFDIPVVLPAGNGADKSRIDWPACIPSALAIGASTQQEEIAKFSNFDRNLVDFYELGYFDSYLPGGRKVSTSGTSVSALIAATKWVSQSNKMQAATYLALYRYFRGGPIIFDEEFKYGRLMFRQTGAVT